MSKIRESMNKIVQNLIEDMKQGGEWIKKWQVHSFFVPKNLVTQTIYRGANPFILANTSKVKGYNNHQWLTFKQASALGGKIKKGEKGTQIFFKKLIEDKEEIVDENGDKLSSLKKRWFWTSFTLFNVEQTEGIEYATAETAVINHLERNATIEEFVASVGAEIITTTTEDKAAYSPSRDCIYMPEMSFFDTAEGYYSTLLHELTHWTLHSSRLNRKRHQEKFDETYCFEELIAELGSSFLCSHFGIDLSKNQHPEYVSMYIKALSNDTKFLWKAASEAQKAFDFLISLSTQNAQKAS